MMETDPDVFASATTEFDARWHGAVMPYVIDKSIKDPEHRRVIEDAIISFNKQNCGCFYIR